jgi:hypothetical protein
VNLAFVDNLCPEAVEHNGALNSPRTDEIVESDRGPAMCLEEDLQETETNKNHNMDILPHWVVSYYMLGGLCLFKSDFGWVSRPGVTELSKGSAHAVKHNHACF